VTVHAGPLARRRAALERLGNEEADVLVVGGGATGAGIARDAVLRGLTVALCEAGDFASQTSSRSSQLIHGGLRYLQYGDLGLVFEGLSERRRLMSTAPHLCRPIEFLFPAYRGERPGLRTIGTGIALRSTTKHVIPILMRCATAGRFLIQHTWRRSRAPTRIHSDTNCLRWLIGWRSKTSSSRLPNATNSRFQLIRN